MDIGLTTLAAAAAVTLVAGFVKGAVGFAMPMIMISGLASLMSAETALAALILPTLASNLYQAGRDGFVAALTSAQRYWRYLALVVIFIALSAQTVAVLPRDLMFLILGSVIILFCTLQLAGLRMHIAPARRPAAELGIGALAGSLGGVSGVWGPPTVMYLTAIETPKREHIRVQGVVYAIGAITLTAAHLQSGVLNAQTTPLSAAMLAPAAIGMAVGVRFQDRLDPDRFRRLTLVVLIVAGANLVRRGLF